MWRRRVQPTLALCPQRQQSQDTYHQRRHEHTRHASALVPQTAAAARPTATAVSGSA